MVDVPIAAPAVIVAHITVRDPEGNQRTHGGNYGLQKWRIAHAVGNAVAATVSL